MKQKISISIDEEKINKIEKLLKDSRFRNKSHLIEYSLEKFLQEEASDSILTKNIKQRDEIRNFKNEQSL